jgi:hypothetical protein
MLKASRTVNNKPKGFNSNGHGFIVGREGTRVDAGLSLAPPQCASAAQSALGHLIGLLAGNDARRDSL